MKKRIAGVALVVIVLLLSIWLWKERIAVRPPALVQQTREQKLVAEPENEEQASSTIVGTASGNLKQEEFLAKAEESVRAIFNASLSLYGKVVDQEGRPIVAANVKISVADKPWDGGSGYQRVTDSNGFFEISGVKGAGIYAEVNKEGYYTGKEGRRLFESGLLPTRQNPAVFKLYRKGELEPLIYRKYTRAELSGDGTPLGYDVDTGEFVLSGGHILIEVKVAGPLVGKYGWAYKLSIPGGGIAVRKHEFDFSAPETGYTPYVEGSVEPSAANWRQSHDQEYFIHLKDGRYGRVRITLGGGSRTFSVRLEQLAINPSGSRNLELESKPASSMSR